MTHFPWKPRDTRGKRLAFPERLPPTEAGCAVVTDRPCSTTRVALDTLSAPVSSSVGVCNKGASLLGSL